MARAETLKMERIAAALRWLQARRSGLPRRDGLQANASWNAEEEAVESRMLQALTILKLWGD